MNSSSYAAPLALAINNCMQRPLKIGAGIISILFSSVFLPIFPLKVTQKYCKTLKYIQTIYFNTKNSPEVDKLL